MSKDTVKNKVKEKILDKIPNLDEDIIDEIILDLGELFSGQSYYDDQGRGYFYLKDLETQGKTFGLNSANGSAEPFSNKTPPIPSAYENANLVGSRVSDDLHKPVLDFDFPIYVEPSLTEGHYHLYIDKEISNEKMKELLIDLQVAGLLEKSHLDTFNDFDQVYVRTSGEINKILEDHNNGKQYSDDNLF